MTEDGYTDLEREELKEASLNSLKVGTKENDLEDVARGVNYPSPTSPFPRSSPPQPYEQFRAPVSST